MNRFFSLLPVSCISVPGTRKKSPLSATSRCKNLRPLLVANTVNGPASARKKDYSVLNSLVKEIFFISFFCVIVISAALPAATNDTRVYPSGTFRSFRTASA